MKEAWCLAASNAAASSRQIIDLYSKRWGVELVFTQLTKAPPLAVWADGDDVADLDLVVGDHDAVDQKFHQLAPLGEVGPGQSRLDPSAEVRGRSRPAGELRGAIDLGFQLVRLDTQRLRPVFHRLAAPLVFRKGNDRSYVAGATRSERMMG